MSVNTDRQVAPDSEYMRAIFTGSKSSRISPWLGDAFLTSAMRATLLLEALSKIRFLNLCSVLLFFDSVMTSVSGLCDLHAST